MPARESGKDRMPAARVRAAGEPAQPRQARSRDTLERLLDAAEAIAREKGLAAAGVPEIAGRAGTSVGNFYRRFRSKEALVEALERRFLAGREERWRRLLEDAAWEGRPAGSIIERVVAEIVMRHRRHRRFLREIALRARPSYERRTARGHSWLVTRLTELIEARQPIVHAEPRAAVAFALEMVSATAGELILFRERSEVRVTERELIAQLTLASVRYLGIASV